MCEDLSDDSPLLFNICILQPEEQHSRVGLTGSIHQLSEILVHCKGEALISYGEGEDVQVTHPGIEVTDRQHIMTSLTEIVFNGPAHPDIDQNLHARTTEGSREYTRSSAIRSAA